MTHWAGEYPDGLMRASFARLRISTKPRAPTSLIVFLAAAFQIPPLRSTSPFCEGAFDTEILSNAVGFHKLTALSFEFTSHVRDQVTHGTCPTHPNHLTYRQNVIRPCGRHGKANVEFRGKIYNVQELPTSKANDFSEVCSPHKRRT